MHRNGFTTIELLFSLAIGAILLVVGVSGFSTTLERIRHDGAVRQLTSAVREARSQAISRGWEFRVLGYDSEASSDRRNQYRVLGRKAAASWPAEESAPLRTDSQWATQWVDVATESPGVVVDYTGDRFELTFDSRGASPGAPDGFNPVTLVGKGGHETALRVSVVGGVTIE